ncbi:MAG: efflux RND transporter periplasmic adaptor subunit, partial [Planctomycetaceae bacterium]
MRKPVLWMIVIACVVGIGAFLGRDRWQPLVTNLRASTATSGGDEDAHESHDHDGHDHGHDHAHDDPDSIELSEQARRNINLHVGPVELSTFERSMTVPGMVVERPGRTKIHVATPLTGVVTNVRPIQGEAILPGTLLFKIRLTHEDLVDTQTRFLQTLEELDVENREIARLEKLTEGVVAGKVVLERQYARQKLEALLNAQRQALILHGLSEPQVETIRTERRLLRELQVFAPTSDENADEFKLTTNPLQQISYIADGEPQKKREVAPYVVQELNVHKGQAVQAGDSLCVLADFSELYIEGSAFEQDSRPLVEAANRGWNVSARIEAGRGKTDSVDRLRVIYMSNEIDKDSRALHFYVALPNEIVRDATTADEHRFIDWKFRPGQRLQVRVPVEELPERIVVPIAAVAADGPEFFVFQENG